MSNQSPAGQIVRSLVKYRFWWMLPTLVCTLLAICFVLFSSKSYNSRQTLVLRDDLVGTFYKPGRFDSFDSLKSAQETILEIARRPRVIRSALEQLGPTRFVSAKNWASDERIERMQEKIQISAPNGAEFGRTEAIVLSVQASTRDRSKQFINFLMDEIESSLRELKGHQFDSMQHELEQAVSQASGTFKTSAKNLKDFEKKVGPDLITLISMTESQAGTNILQSELASLNAEKRSAWSDVVGVEKQIEILKDIEGKPDLEIPQELLQLQPTLASLVTGLNEAFVTFSKSKGRYQMTHPKVRADFRAVDNIRNRINDKLSQILESLNSQLELRQGKYDQIARLVDAKKIRLGELSGMRVDHQTLKSEVAKNLEYSGKARANLAEIKSLGSAAKQVNLISRVGEPQTDIYAAGPSNKIIVFGGMLAGLLTGLGLVMFVSPLDGLPLGPVSFSDHDDDDSAQDTSRSRPSREQYSGSPATAERSTTQEHAASSSAGLGAAGIANAVTSDRIRERMEKISATKQREPRVEVDSKIDEQVTDSAQQPADIPAPTEPIESMVADDSPTESLPSPFENLSKSELPDTDFGQDSDSIDRNSQEASSTESIIERLKAAQNETPQFDEQQAPVAGSTGEVDSQPADPFAGLSEVSSSTPSADGPEGSDNYDPYQRILAGLPSTDSASLSETPNSEPSSSFSSPATQNESPTSMSGSSMTDGLMAIDNARSTQLDSYAQSIVASEPETAVTQKTHQTVAEKINQLDQIEQQNENQIGAVEDPINSDAAIVAENLTDASPSDSIQAAGLPLPTSIHHSSENLEAIGDESVPNIGNEPEDRPTASPVDLDRLKQQIASRSGVDAVTDDSATKSEPTQKTLTDVLSTYSGDVANDDSSKHEVVDKSMADLAKSIRDMCKNLDD